MLSYFWLIQACIEELCNATTITKVAVELVTDKKIPAKEKFFTRSTPKLCYQVVGLVVCRYFGIDL